MSDQTQAALEQAIAAHVADEHGEGYVSAWVVIADHTPIEDVQDGEAQLYMSERDMQSTFYTLGLLHAATASVGISDGT